MRFLVVDDSPMMRRIVVNALKNLGYEEISEAEDGREGFDKLKSEIIDFVITEWNLPGMNGLELTKAIRSDESLMHLPILMVTTRDSKTDIIEALKTKVNNYVVKPFTQQVLKEKIDSILSAMKNRDGI